MNAPTPGWPAGLLAVPLISVLYDLLADGALRHWMNEALPESSDPPEPVTFFRPLKRGVPDLRAKLEMLLGSSLACDQIIFGVDAGSEEEAICEAVRCAFPERDVAVVRCAPDRAVNPKISKLVQMEALARHAAWLLSDSEAMFTADFVGAFRREWQAQPCAALTAGYRFIHLASRPQRCDALAVLLGLWPGLALLRRYGRVNFTLGACTLFRREALRAIGGWAAFGQDLAEDQRMGEALVKSGQTIRLSRHIATLDSDDLSWRDYWRHQRRVAVTYRAANPAGFAGVALTFGPVSSVLGLLFFSSESWFVLAAFFAVMFRWLRVRRAVRLVNFAVPGLVVTLGIASVVEAICWLLSWLPSRVWWSGRWWSVSFRGKFSLRASGKISG
jgi:ceramide glucosyltransferase